jgi:hypothetical protein
MDRQPVNAVWRWGAVLWPSFFSAGVMTMVFFALIDPLQLSTISALHLDVTREQGYTIGFFMFWAGSASSSWFTAMLLGKAGPEIASDDER